MINTLGPYILILFGGGGLATVDVESFEACKAAIVQLEPTRITGVCIAATLIPADPCDECQFENSDKGDTDD